MEIFLKLEENTSALEIFPGSSTFKIFEWTLRFRSTFKYATSDFTGISKASSKIFKSRQSCIWTINSNYIYGFIFVLSRRFRRFSWKRRIGSRRCIGFLEKNFTDACSERVDWYVHIYRLYKIKLNRLEIALNFCSSTRIG